MKDFLKVDFSTWTTDPGMAARYAPIHDMVTELLNRTDPGGYTNMLEHLLAEHKPESMGEAHVIALMADLSWRIRGCLYLEDEMLKSKSGAALLSKLSRYQRRLAREQSRSIRVLGLFAKNRKYAEARMAATLLRRKPCTSVIQ
jgi:hypothetical protein